MHKPRKAISPNTETSKSETSKIDSWNAKTFKFRESQIRLQSKILNSLSRMLKSWRSKSWNQYPEFDFLNRQNPENQFPGWPKSWNKKKKDFNLQKGGNLVFLPIICTSGWIYSSQLPTSPPNQIFKLFWKFFWNFLENQNNRLRFSRFFA